MLEANGAATKDPFELVRADIAVAVLIKDPEGLLEVGLGQELDFVKCGSDELGVVHVTIAIRIRLLHHCDDVWLLELEQIRDGGHVVLELVEGKLAVIVRVPLHEHLMQVFQVFRLCHQVGKDRANARLKLVRLRKIMQVGRQIKLCLIVHFVFTLIVYDPSML